MLRSDTAGYQQELLRYCAEGRDERFGVIEFAVGVDVTAEFRRAVSEVAEEDRHVLHKPGSNRVETGQEWAEVNFVPNWIGHSHIRATLSGNPTNRTFCPTRMPYFCASPALISKLYRTAELGL